MTARAGGAALRRQMRSARRALAPAQRAAFDRQICSHIRRLPAFRAARRVALFFAFDGEPDLSPLLTLTGRRQFFAPVITPDALYFAEIGAGTRLAPNFYGIPEPVRPVLIDPRSIDLVLTPLVAFDESGNRLGVGAGYYDKCFSFLLQRQAWYRPKLVGTAYSVQQLPQLQTRHWDVPLWGAVTENGFRIFR